MTFRVGVRHAPIPFLDLSTVNRRHESAFFRELRKLYRQSAFVGGPWLEKFEADFARATDSPHCVGTASGTSAIHLALIGAGVGPGDEVIVPAFTFPGTAWGVLYLGAKPVFADVHLGDGCVDPTAVEKAVTRKTKAIIAVHLFGHPAPLFELRSIANPHRIALIEDAAQAHGGLYRDRPLGSIGDFGCFSFYPTKNLGGIGDGGAILVKQKSVAERLRRLRDHGQRKRFFPEEIGFNARMDAIQALFLSLKLPSLSSDNARRSSIAARYTGALEGSPTLSPLLPSAAGTSAWHAFVVRARKREAFVRHLQQHGIGNQVYYPAPLPHLKPYREFARGRYPVAEELARTAAALPLHPGMRDTETRRIIQALRSFRNPH